MSKPTWPNAKAFGFHRPHPRREERGEVTDPITGEVTRPPSMAKQAHKEECDINNILKQYRQTGIIRHISSKAAQGVYEDLPDPVEFQDALHTVMAAEASFETLPSSLRSRFNNDPTEFLQFVTDPRNADELIRLGLANEPAAPPAAPPAPEPAPAPSTPPAPQQA